MEMEIRGGTERERCTPTDGERRKRRRKVTAPVAVRRNSYL